MVIVLGMTLPFMTILLNKMLRPTHGTVKREVWQFTSILPIMFTLALLFCTGFMELEKVASISYLLINLAIGFGGFIVYFVAMQMIVQTSINARLEENIGIIERQIELQSEQYDMLTWQINETRAMQHDMRQHTAALNSFAAEGDIEGIKGYLKNFCGDMPRVSEYLHCENAAVNALINYYIAVCKKEYIHFKVQMHIGKKLNIPNNLLCVLLGNLLENAVEACRRMETGERFITLSAGITSGILGINVDNSFNGRIYKKNGVYLSSKRCNCEGIGLSSIKNIAEKYGNGVVFSYDAKVFRATVLLQVNKI